MPIENCACGGNAIDRFYSLFTCDHANCSECSWTNNKCCNGYPTNADSEIGNCINSCVNFYNIPMHEVLPSKIKSFGFCKTSEDTETNTIIGALAIQFTDGTKKLYMNVNKEIFDSLLNANKDFMFINLSQNVCNEDNQCIVIP